MDEPIISSPWPQSSFLKNPAECLFDELCNALLLDDKDEFFRLIRDPEFKPMRRYHRKMGFFLREINMNMILDSDALEIAIAVLNGEARDIIKDDELVFKDGWTPLHLASARASPILIKYLIERGDPLGVPSDYAPLNLKHATPLDLALEVIDTAYEQGFKTVKRPWTPRCSIFELLEYLCEWKMSCLEVIRLLVQNTQNKEDVRKAFLDYANEGKLVKLAALFLATPELFLSSSPGGGSMSSIDTLYLSLNSLGKTTDIEDGLLLLLDVFKLVGHKLIAYLRVSDPEVWNCLSGEDKFPIGFFLREAAHKKLGISSPDDYLLSFFKPVSHVYRLPCTRRSRFDTRINHTLNVLPFEMKREDIDIDYVNRMIPSLKPHEADVLRKSVVNKLSIMPNMCTLFEGTSGIPNKGGKQSSFPHARSMELTRTRSFPTEAADATFQFDFKLIPGNSGESRVMNPTNLSIMPNMCTRFEGTSGIPNKGGKQSSFPHARSIELTRTRSFSTEAADAIFKLDFTLIPGNSGESRVMNPTKLSIMPNICTLFEGTTRITNKGGIQNSFPRAWSIELMRTQSFRTKAANAKHKFDFKNNLGNGWESRVMNPTKPESFFSARRLSHFPMIAKRLIK